jgi:hypothetical protein
MQDEVSGDYPEVLRLFVFDLLEAFGHDGNSTL